MRDQPTYASAPEERSRDEYGYTGEREPAPREGRYQPPWWVRLIGTGLIVCLVLLLLGGIASGALALLAYTTPAATATSTQSFNVGGAPNVVVRAHEGAISVVAGSADQVTVRITKSARAISSGLAQQVLSAIHVTAWQAGQASNTITIEERTDALDLWPGFLWRHLQIDVTVPRTTNVTATLQAGSFTGEGLQGSAAVRANAGSIELTDAQLSDASLHTDAGTMTLTQVVLSGAAHLSTNAGSIELWGSLAPRTTLDVSANAGSVTLTLPTATSAHLEASTNAGDISIQGWPIAVQQAMARSSASGDLSPSPTGSIIIHTNAGSVSVRAG